MEKHREEWTSLWSLFFQLSQKTLTYFFPWEKILHEFLEQVFLLSQAEAVSFWKYTFSGEWHEELTFPRSWLSSLPLDSLAAQLEKHKNSSLPFSHSLGPHTFLGKILRTPLHFNPSARSPRLFKEPSPKKILGALLFFSSSKEKLLHLSSEALILLYLQYRSASKASRDQTTQLYHRSFFEEVLREELEYSRSHNLPLALLMLDIDRLSQLQNTSTFPTPVEYLKQFSQKLVERLRSSDICCRYGSDEFLILLPQTGSEGAKIVAEKIARIPHSTPSFSPTLSIGISCFEGQEITHEELIQRADQALCEAKAQGGGRIVFWEEKLSQKSQRTDKLAGIFTPTVTESLLNLSHLFEILTISRQSQDLKSFLQRAFPLLLSITQGDFALLYLHQKGQTHFYYGMTKEHRKLHSFPSLWEEKVQTSSKNQITILSLSEKPPLGVFIPLRQREFLGYLTIVYEREEKTSPGLFERLKDIFSLSLSPFLERQKAEQKQKELQKKVEELEGKIRTLSFEKRQKKHQIQLLERERESLFKKIQELQENLERRHSITTIIGKSKAIEEIRSLIEKLAPTDIPILITGNSGTGKELVAKAIHYTSHRRDKPLIVENCATLSEELFESELFGYQKGAFTGASFDKKGILERASGGTLFLDEVGELNLKAQAKLARALEEGKIRPLGSTKWIPIDIRPVATTRYDLRERITRGTFRQDLYYRLATVCLHLPDLKDRKEDIPLLVDYFLSQAAKEANLPKKAIHPLVLEIFSEYDWPGNVRELENEVKRLYIFSDEVILPEHISPHIRRQSKGYPFSFPTKTLKWKEAKQLFERHFLEWQLQKHGYNISQTAKTLGITRQHLHRLIGLYKIEPKEEWLKK